MFGIGNCPPVGVVTGVPRPGAPDRPRCADRPLLATESPKITRPFAGRLRTAVTQSVGAACLAAGTLGSQMRHMPGGGRRVFGTLSPDARPRPGPCASPGAAASTVNAKASDNVRRMTNSTIGLAGIGDALS
jgi:hypothetical protein